MKIRLIRAILFLTTAQFAEANWTPMEIGEPSCYDVLALSNQSRIFYATGHAGLWKFTIETNDWIPISDQLQIDRISQISRMSSRNDLNWITLDIIDTDVGAINKFSFDGGQSWESLPNSFYSNSSSLLVCSVGDTPMLFHANSRWFRRSTDGVNWNLYMFDSEDNIRTGIFLDPYQDSTLFITTSGYASRPDIPTDAHAILRSDDLGMTWHNMFDIQSDFGAYSFDIGNILRLSNMDLIVTAPSVASEDIETQKGLFRSTDDGSTWTVESNGLPANFRMRDVVERLSYPGQLIAIGSSSYGIYSSNDFGMNWTPFMDGLPSHVIWPRSISYNAENNSVYLCTGAAGVWELGSDATSWTVLPGPPIGNSGKVSVVNDVLYYVDGTTVLRRMAPFGQWEDLDIDPAPGDGKYWEPDPVFGAKGDTLYTRIASWNSTFYEADSCWIARSTDNGQSFQHWKSFDGSWYDNFSMAEIGEHTVIAGFWYHQLIYTVDFSENWNNFASDSEFSIEAVSLSDDGIYIINSYSGGLSSEVLLLDPLTQEIQNLDYPGPFSYLSFTSIIPYGEDLFVIAGGRCSYLDRNHVWHVPDSLQIISNIQQMIVFGDENPVLFGCTYFSERNKVSYDHGQTWTFENHSLPFEQQNFGIADIAYDSAERRIWASTYGGLDYLNEDEVSDSPERLQPAVVNGENLLTLYPNPFNNSLTLNLALSHAGQVSVKMYNVEGQLVQDILDQRIESAQYSKTIQLNNLSSGIYFLVSRSDILTDIDKAVLIR